MARTRGGAPYRLGCALLALVAGGCGLEAGATSDHDVAWAQSCLGTGSEASTTPMTAMAEGRRTRCVESGTGLLQIDNNWVRDLVEVKVTSVPVRDESDPDAEPPPVRSTNALQRALPPRRTQTFRIPGGLWTVSLRDTEGFVVATFQNVCVVESNAVVLSVDPTGATRGGS